MPAPGFDAAASAEDFGVSSLTWSHTCTGTNLALLVIVASRAVAVTGVTYNSVPLSNLWAVQDSGNQERSEGWILVAPATGAHNVVVTLVGSSGDLLGGSESYVDVHQTTPTGTAATNSNNFSNAPTVDVTSASGELVVDGVAARSSLTAVGAGQTQRVNLTGGADSVGGSEEAGAATVTMSWTMAAENPWAIGGVSLKPLAAGGAAVYHRLPLLGVG